MVRGAPDRRHRGQPELVAGPVRGVPVRPPRMPGHRFDQRGPVPTAHPRDVLDPDVDGALPGQPRRHLPALPHSTSIAPSSDPAPIVGARRRCPPRAPGDEMRPSSTGSPSTPPTARSTTAGMPGAPESRPSRTTSEGRRCRATRRSASPGPTGRERQLRRVHVPAEPDARLLPDSARAPWSPCPIMGISCNPRLQTSPPPARPTSPPARPPVRTHRGPTRTPVSTRTEPTCPSPAPCGGPVELAQPHQRPLSFAPPPDACSLSSSAANNVIDIYGSELMIQATGAVGAPLLPQQPEHLLVRARPDRRAPGAQPGGDRQGRGRVHQLRAAERIRQTGRQRPGGRDRILHLLRHRRGQRSAVPEPQARSAAPGQAAHRVVSGRTLHEAGRSRAGQEPAQYHRGPRIPCAQPGHQTDIQFSGAGSDAASELMAMSSDSDVMEALTTYINDDPTARAWLNGTPDQWGMVVNPAYKGIQLPVDQWPLLSTFEPTTYYQSDTNDCLYNDPVPFQPLVAAPLATLEDISESIQYALPNSTVDCDQPTPGLPLGEKLVTDGQQSPGNQFMIGITPLADDQRYLLSSASLETTSGDFVAPTDCVHAGGGRAVEARSDHGDLAHPLHRLRPAERGVGLPGDDGRLRRRPHQGPADCGRAGLRRLPRVRRHERPDARARVSASYPPATSRSPRRTASAASPSYTEAAAQDVAAQNGQVPSVLGTPAGGDCDLVHDEFNRRLLEHHSGRIPLPGGLRPDAVFDRPPVARRHTRRRTRRPRTPSRPRWSPASCIPPGCSGPRASPSSCSSSSAPSGRSACR